MMSLRCRSCNTAFHDHCSSEVHFQYTHSNSDRVAEPARNEQPPDAAEATTENNNNFFKFENVVENSNDTVMTAISPGTDNREFQLPPVQQRDHLMYDVHQQHYPPDNYTMLNSQDYSRASPIVQNSSPYSFVNDQRYHPYYKQSFRELPPRNQVVGPPAGAMSPFRCQKCDYHTHSQTDLLHHYNIGHGGIPAIGMHPFDARFGNPPVNGGGAEPQAEILDLDSHKVHVYQPPNGEDSQDSDLRNSYFHTGATNGKGGTPLPSPDFGSVSTTTENIENLQSTRSPYYDQNPNVNSTPTQISSSDNPTGRSSSKSSKNTNGTWKSNEARRPKTYNCSACNKWFTSSGHLKRHYNTTLHKNAVKQSGAPDPASMPVSAHHHPHKDPTFPSSRQAKADPSSVVSEASDTPPNKLADNFSSPARNSSTGQMPPNAFLHNSPNLMAGPSEIPGGLLHHPSYSQPTSDLIIKSPSPITSLPPHSNHTNYLPIGVMHPQPGHTMPPFFHQHTPTTIYPNFKAPHVSIPHQVTTSRIHPTTDGNLTATNVPTTMMTAANDTDEDCKPALLPSFSCIQKTTPWNAPNNTSLELFLNTLDDGGNVGGPFTSNDVETATSMLLKNLENADNKQLSEPVLVKIPRPDTISPHQQQQVIQIKQELTSAGNSPTGDTNVTSSTVEQASPPPANGNYNCTVCNKHFNKACYLTQHNKSFHSGYKPFKCARCGKRFQKDEQFRVHSEKHAGEKPYKCEICPKQFNHKTDLRRHACLHTNERPFNCDICQKGFIRKDHMLKHRETHQNRKNVQRRIRAPKIKKEIIDCDY
ncbi:transcription factor Zelda [Planococcus citri]|uniref:transcription factor Zelda n=1 Tax=Planococcus citri TaxID=170843 RepID=UPI0031FA1F2A